MVFRRFFLATSAFAALSTPARAQQIAALEADTAADELVVTDRRDNRDTEVQKTPIAITSLSGLKLEQQGITSVRELGNIAPNLFQSRVAVSYLNTQLFIRGIGEPDAQGKPSVAVYIDGVYLPKNVGLNQELLDIDRVEVLRGPQGQDGGHAAPAGVLSITTIDPGDTPQFRVQASYGNWNDARLSFLAAGKLTGNLYGSLTAGYHRRDGFNRNTTVGRDVNDVDYFSGRAKLRLAVTEDFDLKLTVGGIRDRSTSRGVQDLLTGDKTSRNQVFPENSFDQLNASLNADWRVDDNTRISLLLSAYGFDQSAWFDNSGDFHGRGSQFARYEDRTYQTELKLSHTSESFDVSAGVFGYREEWFTNRRANTAANATNDPALIRYRPVYTLIQQNNDIWAGFAEGVARVGPRLTLTAGARLQWEHRTNGNQLYNLVAAAPFQSTAANFLAILNAPPQALVWSTQASHSWTTFQPKVAAEYAFTDDARVYATIGRGDKSAGFDYRAQTPTPTGFRQAEIPFDPEKITNYEVGFKFATADHKLRLNAAAFYINFDDIQLSTNDPVALVTRRYNAGKGSTRGVELEANLQPSQNLQVDASASYLKARLDEFSGTVTRSVFPNGFTLNTSPFPGAVLPNAPEFQARAAASWILPAPGPGRWSLHSDINFQSKSYTDANNNPSAQLPDQTYINGQLRWASDNDRWNASLAVRNLTNAQYALPPGYSPATNGTPLFRTTNYNDPRTILLTLGCRI
ncbi:TonB-dependent receptor [Polymorphobacter glacialis]|uniref:TonB-dependent receptor n=1 Tax=Sandarakinorhabdus glacialis TaxID=1614636 RepID=A0A916ZU39_9SPHN|nr:TonB-dependent receptor [Polymorphobacter glacialis]GGE14303.1 TonB-dependent receptor [Polymorphobacter glacialis]